MSERENLQRDNQLVKEVGDLIETSISDITSARNEQDFEAVEKLSYSLERQCSAYRHLRELDV